MAGFSIIVNERGQVMVSCLAKKHAPPLSVSATSGRLRLELSRGGATSDAGEISAVAASALEACSEVLFVTLDGSRLLGESMVPVSRAMA